MKLLFEASEGFHGFTLLRAVAFSGFLFFGHHLMSTIFEEAALNALGNFSLGLLIFVFLTASAGTFYLTSFALVALSTGFSNVLLWFHHTVEVDAVPLETPVVFKSYSDLAGLTPSSLRHGIYDMPEVRADIASVINAVVRKKSPKLTGGFEIPQ